MRCNPAGCPRARRIYQSRSYSVIGDRHLVGLGELVDATMDGFKDVVFGGTLFFERGGTFSILSLDEKLRKKASYRFQSPSKNPTHVFPHVVSGDLNEDGMPDVIGIGPQGGIAIHLRAFVNHGTELEEPGLGFQSRHYTPRESDPGQIGSLVLAVRVVQCLDVDGDGHEDLLLAGDYMGVGGYYNASGLLFLRGDGRGNLARPKVLVAGRVLHVETVRWQAEYKLDLYVLGESGRVVKLHAKARGGYLAEKWLLTAIDDAETLRVRDVDQDGNQDFVILANRPKRDRIELAVYRELSEGRPGPAWTKVVPLGADSGIVDSWLLEDMDGDGSRDLWISPVRKKEGGKVGFVYLKSQQRSIQAVRRLGTATRTGRGVTPRISTMGGLPRLGNSLFGLRMSDVPGDASPYWLWISHVRMDVPILGMRVRVFSFRTLLARSQGAGNRGGLVSVPFRIPGNQNLVGQSLLVQWVFPSKGAKNPLSLARSEALEIIILSKRNGSGR